MDFDSALLTRVLEVCSEESSGPEETVLLIRQRVVLRPNDVLRVGEGEPATQ